MASSNTKKTTTRKSSSRGKAASNKRTGKKQTKDTSFLKDEIIILILFAVAVLLFISNFHVGGAVGEFVSNILFGLTGLYAYVLPIVIFLVAVFAISNKENTVAAIKAAAMVLISITICGMLEFLTGDKDSLETIQAFYTYAAAERKGGGVIGGVLCKYLSSAFGVMGTWVILCLLFIICVVLISQRSFLSGVKAGGKKVYHTAKEDSRRRKERAKERALEREEQEKEKRVARTEKKVSGVALDTKLPKNKKIKTSDEMREIHRKEEPVLADMEEMFAMPEYKPAAETETEPVFLQEPEAVSVPEPEEFPIHIAPYMEEEPVQEPEPAGLREPEPEYKPVKEEKKSADSQAVEEAQKEAELAMKQAVESMTQEPYQFPPIDLLKLPKKTGNKNAARELKETAMHLQQVLKDFGVSVTVTDVSCGPSVTRYELQPDQGVKVSKIVALADDIKLNLAVADVRIEAPIPGKAAVGIEVPNKENTTVSFRELIASKEFTSHPSKIAFAVGKDIAGKIMVTDIGKMPHLLIAGATGSGKSVCINTLIMSILYKADPEDVKLIMIDPKVVELSVYNGIPHLFIPVVTDPKKAAGALNWAVAEMTDRYQKFAEYNVRNLEGYNEKIKSIAHIEDENKPKKLPQIVIIVDELADLMMVAPGEVEDAICRLAQLARAAGIHLIIATQRPSVNVITGLIKANMPSRIAFAVSSGVDSRTIIDMNGAEKLLGKGDMLFSPYGLPKPVRVQGAFVSDEEVGAVVEFLSARNQGAVYSQAVEEHMNQVQTVAADTTAAGGGGDSRDVLFAEAGKFIIEKDKASIGMLQRWFKVGFNRAARIMDQLAEAGVVGEEAGTKPREVLMTMEEFEQYIEEYL